MASGVQQWSAKIGVQTPLELAELSAWVSRSAVRRASCATDNLTWRRDPVGRETTYTYAANGIDLLEVRNTTPGRNDLLAQYSTCTAGHLPQTSVEAAGQTTLRTYNPAGQVLTVTNPKQSPRPTSCASIRKLRPR